MQTRRLTELQLLRNRLESILVDHPVPTDEELPYLMNLAAAVAKDHPGLDAAQVLEVVTEDTRNWLWLSRPGGP